MEYVDFDEALYLTQKYYDLAKNETNLEARKYLLQIVRIYADIVGTFAQNDEIEI